MKGEPEKKVVWVCILGEQCDCGARHGEVDQFCANSRRREVDPREDDDE